MLAAKPNLRAHLTRPTSRLASRFAKRKLVPGFFGRAPRARAWSRCSQVADLHQGNRLHRYETAPGCVVAPNKTQQLNDCYAAARAAHSADTTKLGQIADARIESFFGSLAGQRGAARAALGESIARTVRDAAASVAIGSAVGAGASWQWARTAAAGRNLYAAARSWQQVNAIAAEVASLQTTANIVRGVSGTAAAVGYNVVMADNGANALLGSGAELIDFAAGNEFSQTGILLGLTQATLEYISASGLSDAQAAGVVAGIRGSVGQTQQVVDGRLQSALSECDRKFK